MSRSQPFHLDFQDLADLTRLLADADEMFRELYSNTGTILVSDIIDGKPLTAFNDTNITLTLGGNPANALLNATSITAGWTGVLDPSRGGTGTSTVFTPGSVVFAGPSGVFAQDNANFFWDDTNNRLGIGTAIPTEPIHLSGTVDGKLRSFVNNLSTGVNAFADVVIKTGTIAAFIGSSGQNMAAGPLGGNRSWLDTAAITGSGWDYSAPITGGNHRWYTEGYANSNLRMTVDITGVAVRRAGLGSTSTDGSTLTNDTPATGGATVQISPRFRLRGNAWDTAASETVDFFVENLPVSAATPTGTLKIGYSLNGGAATYPMTLTSGGVPTFIGTVLAPNFQTSITNGSFFILSRSGWMSSADGKVEWTNFAGTSGFGMDFTTDGTFKLRNKSQTAGTGNLDIGAKLTAYNNIATAGWGLVAIPGSGRSVGQTGDVASVTAFTVTGADGDFIVSCNMNVTTYTAGTQSIQVTYTDETNTSRTLTLTTSSITGTFGLSVGAAGAFEGVPLHIRAKVSTAITVKTVGTVWNGTYNVSGNIMQIA